MDERGEVNLCEFESHMITMVMTGRLPDVVMHPDFSTLMEHKAFIFAHKRELSLAPELQEGKVHVIQEGKVHVMFVTNQHYDDRHKLNHV